MGADSLNSAKRIGCTSAQEGQEGMRRDKQASRRGKIHRHQDLTTSFLHVQTLLTCCTVLLTLLGMSLTTSQSKLVVDLPCINKLAVNPDGEVLSRCYWKTVNRLAYVDSLGDVRLSGTNGETRAQSLLAQINRAAGIADMPNRRLRQRGQPSKPRSHMPFFDQECQRMKRAIDLHRRTHGPGSELQQLEREYHAHNRAKRRAY